MLAALFLADGRLPTGGHAHSAGVESAVADGRVVDVGTLGSYLRGRLHTRGVDVTTGGESTVGEEEGGQLHRHQKRK